MRSFVARSGLLQSFGDIRSRLSHSCRVKTPPPHRQSRAAAVPSQMPQRKKDTGGGSSKFYKHTHSYLQVLGNGTDTGDTTPSLLLFFDSYRYVFNVGEGFQRYCFQHRLKLGKLNDVFLTRMSTEAAGGVPGLFITLSDYGQQNGNGTGRRFNVHGPMKLTEFVKALQTFVSIPPRNEMTWSSFGTMETAGLIGEPLVTNEQVEIRPIVLIPTKEDAVLKTDGAVPVACYVCRLADVKGKFLPEKAQELGVKMGPDCAKLVSGVCVVGETGRVIHPHEVMEPTVAGGTVIIVDCPDGSYTEALFASPGFESYMDGNGGEIVMVHLGPFSVVSGDAYQQWMSRFSTEAVRHIFVNERATNATAIMRDAAVTQCKLNLVDERYFPLQQRISWQEEWKQNGVIMGKDLLQYHLKPVGKKGVDTSQLLEPFRHEEVIQSLKEEDPDALNAIHAFRERRRKCQETSASSIGPEELEITFLGTGSAIPSKYRNVTGIYLDFFARGSMLLDCGEGSYGQLIRRFGKEGADEAIKKLKQGLAAQKSVFATVMRSPGAFGSHTFTLIITWDCRLCCVSIENWYGSLCRDSVVMTVDGVCLERHYWASIAGHWASCALHHNAKLQRAGAIAFLLSLH